MLKKFNDGFGLMGMAVAIALLAGCSSNQDDFAAPPAVLGPTETAQPDALATAPPPPASSGVDEPFSLRPGEQLVPHKVVRGDSVWKLARQYNTRVSRIVAANNLESENMIIIGQTLKIPTAGGAAAAPAPTPAPSAPAPLTPAPLSPAPVLTPPAAPPAPPAPPTNPAPLQPTTPPPSNPAPSTPPPNINFGTPPAPSNGGAGAGTDTGTETPSAPKIVN